MALLVRLAALAVLYGLGGWYWCVVSAPMLIIGIKEWGPGLLWLGVFAVTGDRRMFFPFTIYQAMVFGQLWGRGLAAGAGVVIGIFAMIRIEQEASFRVLGVELVVAIVAASAGAACRKYGVMAAAGAASLVALAGLAL